MIYVLWLPESRIKQTDVGDSPCVFFTSVVAVCIRTLVLVVSVSWIFASLSILESPDEELPLLNHRLLWCWFLSPQ